MFVFLSACNNCECTIAELRVCYSPSRPSSQEKRDWNLSRLHCAVPGLSLLIWQDPYGASVLRRPQPQGVHSSARL